MAHQMPDLKPRAAFLPTSPAVAGGVAALSLTVGLLVGWIGTGVVGKLRRRQLRHAPANPSADADSDAAIRPQFAEWEPLVRDLHDVIVHQLSTASLQVMAAEGSRDLPQLHRSLSVVGELTAAAITDLQLLGQALRDGPFANDPALELEALTGLFSPTEAGKQTANALREAGLRPEIQIPTAADQLPLLAQRTLVRVVEAACEHAVAHAPAGTSVALSVEIGGKRLSLAAHGCTGPRITPVQPQSFRAVGERVRLTAGHLSFQSTPESWSLDMSLPITPFRASSPAAT